MRNSLVDCKSREELGGGWRAIGGLIRILGGGYSDLLDAGGLIQITRGGYSGLFCAKASLATKNFLIVSSLAKSQDLEGGQFKSGSPFQVHRTSQYSSKHSHIFNLFLSN